MSDVTLSALSGVVIAICFSILLFISWLACYEVWEEWREARHKKKESRERTTR